MSPSKGVFYCFGCGKGGDAITFLRELETLSYVEAIERLAATAGVQLHYEGDSPAERRAAERRKALYRANEEAAGLYTADAERRPRGRRRRAPTSPSAASPPRRSRRSRSATRPTYPDFLLRRLSGRRDLSSDLLLEAGLATRGDDGTVRDRFRGRLTFPIHDLQGRHIGFGARVLPDDPRAGEQAKYLNTAETPIYRKQEILYNLHRARSAIARSGEAFVVEGYTDVIGLSQAGIDERRRDVRDGARREALRAALAVRRSGRCSSFDSDEAGARAAERAFAFQERFPVQAVVMIMPDGLDPAEFVVKHGAEAVREAADRRAAAGRVHGPARSIGPARPDHDRGAVGGRGRGAARSSSACQTRSAGPSTRGSWPTWPASSEVSVHAVAPAAPVGGKPAGGRRDHPAGDRRRASRARDAPADGARRRYGPRRRRGRR